MKNFVFTICLFACFSSFATWLPFTSDPERNVSVYLDPETKRVEKDNIQIWTLYDHKKPEKLPSSSGRYLSVKMLWEFNCSNRMARILSSWFYSQNMGLGKYLDEAVGYNPSRWDHVPPGTLGNNMLETLCRTI